MNNEIITDELLILTQVFFIQFIVVPLSTDCCLSIQMIIIVIFVDNRSILNMIIIVDIEFSFSSNYGSTWERIDYVDADIATAYDDDNESDYRLLIDHQQQMSQEKILTWQFTSAMIG
jgi:hypothetical protein